MYVWWGKSKRKGKGGTLVVGEKKRKEKIKNKKIKRWCTWVVGKNGKKKNNNNNVIIKTKSKNQNYVPNIIFFFKL